MQDGGTVIARNGIVASSHELASFHGAKVLSEGGNVVDAAIATSAILCVTQNNLCGLGGDLFALVKCNGRIWDLNGSGRASENATIGFYRDEMKLSAIPKRGPLACPTVPGIVHAWGELHSKFCTIELKTLLAPAISYARAGFPVTENYARSVHASAQFLGEYEGWAQIFLPNGSVPKTGSLLKQPDLSNSLELIANEGPSTFYEGALAERIAEGISKQGGLVTGDDLKNHSSTWDVPLKTNYRGINVYETAPNSQGATVLLWLNMLEEYDLARKFALDTTELIELLIDTCLKSYAERSKHIADPVFHELPSDFISKKFAKSVLHSAPGAPLAGSTVPTNSGDTTYFTIGNSKGESVSIIQSNYMGFGSGLVPRGTGFVMHNRGCYFTLDRRHHNSIQPGKRPFHTLCASMGETESRKTAFTIGCMGGDIQPQVHVQLMTKMIDYGIDPQRAISGPRWVIPFTIYEKPSAVYLEPRFETLIPKLASARHKKKLRIEMFDAPSSQTGHAQAIQFGPEGSLAGGADPRGDGHVVGF